MSEQDPELTPETIKDTFSAIRGALAAPQHEHSWQAVDVWRDRQQPPHPRHMPIPSTFALLVCRNCNLPQAIELEGIWTIEQVRGQLTT